MKFLKKEKRDGSKKRILGDLLCALRTEKYELCRNLIRRAHQAGAGEDEIEILLEAGVSGGNR